MLDSAMKIAVQLAKWFSKQGVKNIFHEHQQSIQKHVPAVALLNDDLQEPDKQTQGIS